MEENKCYDLRPEFLEVLSSKDCLKQIFEKQSDLQEKLGRMALYRDATMFEKCEYIKDHIFHMNAELVEMMERLPFKNWKKYSEDFKNDWIDETQRVETLFEFIDVMHFFVNIALVLGFTPEEIFHYYMAKNKENFDRQDRGY